MKPLASRKQLLIAESELNRAQLAQEWQAMTDDAHALATQARTLGSVAAVAATLVAGLVTFTRGKPAAAAKSSWFQKITRGARLASTVWLAFRAVGSASRKSPM